MRLAGLRLNTQAWTPARRCDISPAFNRDSTTETACQTGSATGIKIMEVTETNTEGLSRTFKVVVPASELAAKLDSRIDEIRPQMNLKGFRPGKVPASHVRKMFGKSSKNLSASDILERLRLFLLHF